MRLIGLGLLVSLLALSCAPRDPSVRNKKNSENPGNVLVDVRPPTDDLNHLKNRLQEVIKDVKGRPLRTGNAFWTIFHGILGNGIETQLVRDGAPPVNAIEYIRTGGKIRGLEFISYEN